MNVRDEKALWAIAPIFAALSFYYGNWSACIPWIEDDRDMDNGTFGNYLSVAVIGALLAMPTLPFIQDLLGSAILTVLGFVLLGIGFTVLCIDSSNLLFIVGMILNGFSTIIVFSATIAQGSLLEKRQARQWMGTLSGISGIGGLIGGFVGGWMLEYTSYKVWMEMLACSVFACVISFVCYPFLYSKDVEDSIIEVHNSMSENGSLLVDVLCCNKELFAPEPVMHETEVIPFMRTGNSSSSIKGYQRDWLGLGMICSIASLSFIVEASIGDWSGIYLIQHWDCGYLVGIMGYVAQKVATIIAGYTCDYVVHKYSKYVVFQVSNVIAGIGLMISFLAYFLPVTNVSLSIAIMGFFVCGFGMGWNVPLWYSFSSGGVRGFSVSESSSIVMAFSNSCYFVGPTIFGNFASACGDTAYAFGAEVILTILMAICAWGLPQHYFRDLHDKEENTQDTDSGEESSGTVNPNYHTHTQPNTSTHHHCSNSDEHTNPSADL
jgi:MFS family permease